MRSGFAQRLVHKPSGFGHNSHLSHEWWQSWREVSFCPFWCARLSWNLRAWQLALLFQSVWKTNALRLHNKDYDNWRTTITQFMLGQAAIWVESPQKTIIKRNFLVLNFVQSHSILVSQLFMCEVLRDHFTLISWACRTASREQELHLKMVVRTIYRDNVVRGTLRDSQDLIKMLIAWQSPISDKELS